MINGDGRELHKHTWCTISGSAKMEEFQTRNVSKCGNIQTILVNKYSSDFYVYKALQ